MRNPTLSQLIAGHEARQRRRCVIIELLPTGHPLVMAEYEQPALSTSNKLLSVVVLAVMFGIAIWVL